MGYYGWILGIFFIILMLFIFIYLFKRFSSGQGSDFFSNNNDNSINILKQRFARGEISEEEYLRIYKVLRDK